MQAAGDTTVLGDFNDAVVTTPGVTARFFRREGKFFVNTEGAGGNTADFEIRYTFGLEPLQQYLIEFPGGRLQALSIAWDTHRRRWFSLHPDRAIPLDDPLHWTGRYQNWNLMCAECHTTNLRKGYNVESDSYQTVWDAPNVGCQACHGPGQAHVAWAGARRAGTGTKAGDARLLVNFRSRDARYQVDNCARCHSRRVRLSAEEQPGHPLLDEFRPQLLRADLYHADGQQLGEVFEYGSFVQSKMYQRGVRCTDCHDAHRARPQAEGNALCTRCHREQPALRFPTLKARAYDSPAHHFHRRGSPGAACVNCHMPARTYMGIDARRDHSMRIPRPDLSARLGTPNACTRCHTNRSPRWAAAAVRRWHGPQAPQDARYAEAIAAGRAGARDAEGLLIALAAETAQPAIVRATALDLLRGYGTASIAVMMAATKDEDPAVRVAAVAGLERLPVEERIGAAAPLLTDPIRAVRIEAVRVLASVPPARFTPSQRRQFDAALAEFRNAQMAMADMPSAQVTLGGLQEDLGQRDLAERSYETALRIDPYFVPARTNLARLYDAMRRVADAERVLRAGLGRAPGNGELHYSLGLLLAEDKRIAEAAEELGDAVRLMPRRARVLYNYGLTLQQMGRRHAAEAALLRAYELDTGDSQIVYALAIFYLQQQADARAMVYAKHLSELTSTDAGARQLLERLQHTVARGRPRGPRRP